MNTRDWGSEAICRFPDLIQDWDSVTDPCALWNELSFELRHAYDNPQKVDLVPRIYEFAFWCCGPALANQGNAELPQWVHTCFFNELPWSDPALHDMPNWFTPEEFQALQSTLSWQKHPERFQMAVSIFQGQPPKSGWANKRMPNLSFNPGRFAASDPAVTGWAG
ncbi:MAG: hypothetical protein IPN59_06800 [Holophaga sp.]|nr:hypothetical protein [Holophaga sp.]